jgi:hypothetical protein
MVLDLEQQEVQVVLNSLAAQPYAQVAGLISKILNQVQATGAPQETKNGEASQ